MSTRRWFLSVVSVAAAIATIALSGCGFASKPGQPVNTLDSPSGAAIKGYDPVAYFAAGKPLRGSPENVVQHGGATWHFATAANKTAFEREPAKYVPAYGGYCAYGVSQGYLVKIEPDAWSIRDGRLYLNYDTDVRKQWESNPVGFIATADKNWPNLVRQN